MLVLPLVGIEPAGSPRVHSTIAAIARISGPVAHSSTATRPVTMALPAWREHSSRARSGLCKPSPSPDEPTKPPTVRQLLELASPLGLYGEEMDPISHRHLGNYPQALTHAVLLQAALSLREPGNGAARGGG